jgi:RNA polymerase primary sigma factor
MQIMTDEPMTVKSTLRKFRLSEEFAPVLSKIIKKGEMSASEALQFVPQSALGSRERLKNFIEKFTEFLSYLGVNIRGLESGNGRGTIPFEIPLKKEVEKKVRYPRGFDKAELIGMARPEAVDKTFCNLDILKKEQKKGKDLELRYYLAEIKNIPLLSREEEHNLGLRAKAGDIEARNKLVEHNLRFAVMIAKKYVGRCRVMDLLDLIQEGNLGLMNAAKKFDPEKGYRFATYAGWWIKQKILREIQNLSGVCRIPVHLYDNFRKIKLVTRDYEKKFHRMPEMGEISEAAGLTLYETIGSLDLMRRSVLYLDETIEDGADPYSCISGPNQNTCEDYVFAKEEIMIFQALVFQILEGASRMKFYERNKRIFIMRYGLDNGGERRTLEEMGLKFKITRERVRQICDKIWVRAFKVLKLEREISFGLVDKWFEHKVERIRMLENLIKYEAFDMDI